MTGTKPMNNAHISLRRAVSGAWAGKTIGRIFLNETVRTECAGLSGRVLDLAGGKGFSYLQYLPSAIELVRTDLHASPGVAAVDMNMPLPFPGASFDAVFLFSALYAAEEPAALMREIHRILKPQGACYISSPFIANEMPEPHDYLRFTAEGLERLCRESGFSSVAIQRMGERASAATQLLHPFFLFNIVRMFVYPLALLFDNLIPRSVRAAHPSPIAYFVRAAK